VSGAETAARSDRSTGGGGGGGTPGAWCEVRWAGSSRARAEVRGLLAALVLLGSCGSPGAPDPTVAPANPDRLSVRATDYRARPNVVVVFTDDQGWADIGPQGAVGFRTPNLDRLASEGRRFTDFYVAQPVCSASRAALLTGCYPNRIGIHGALGPASKIGIHADETTLAELCRSRGYATAHFGKWHLGYQPEFSPLRHGFDEFHGIPYSNDMWPGHPENPAAWGDLPTIDGERVVAYNGDQRRFTGTFTRRAVGFVERCARENQPFFLYLAHPMPHVPLFPSADFAGRSEQGTYGDVIEEIDWSVGQVMDAVERAGLTDDTLFVFTSDNGPWLSYGDHAGSAVPLREGKGTTFEGGVRVPCVVRWPRRVPAGTVCAQPVMTIDLFPTIAEAIGAELPALPIDGESMLSLLTAEPGSTSPQAAYFFWYHRAELEAVRAGRWKLHFPHRYRTMEGRAPGSGGQPGLYDYDARTELALFDLATDVGETTDVSGTYPEVVARLVALADAQRAELGDGLTGVAGSAVREPGRVAAGR